MEFTYYGGNCVQINTKNLKIIIDPVTGEYGPNPKLKADATLYTQLPAQETKLDAGFTITSPGEYELRGVTIDGIAAQLHTQEDEKKLEGTAYLISVLGLRVLVCGNIAAKLDEDQIDRVDGVDVLIVPVGGRGLTLDKEAASNLVSQFSPSYIIPVHYEDGATKYPIPQETVDGFLNEVGSSGIEPVDKFKLTDRDNTGDTKVVLLQVRS